MNIASIGTKTAAPEAPRTSALMRTRKGPICTPIRVLGYGAEGVGKSTFAAGAPSPIWLGAEGGTVKLDVERLPEPETWDEAMAALSDVRNDAHAFKTLVLDPLGWLEPLCWKKVTPSGDLEKVPYGKGFEVAMVHWRQMIDLVSRIWTEREMNVVVLAHAAMRKHPNPVGPTWPQWMPALDTRAGGAWAQWVDHVLFMQVETVAVKGEGQDKRMLGQTTGLRIAHAAPSGGWIAKSRGLPESFPLSWTSMVEALEGAAARTAELRAELTALLEGMPEDYAAKARALAAQPTASMEEIVNKVRTKKESMK